MATVKSETMQSVTSDYEIEGQEVISEIFDGALLRDLLEELESEEEKIAKKGYIMESAVIDNDEDEIKVDQFEPINKDYEYYENNWVDMMKSSPLLQSDGTTFWYIDDLVEMDDFGYSIWHYGDVFDGASSCETTYTCLWEDS